MLLVDEKLSELCETNYCFIILKYVKEKLTSKLISKNVINYILNV